MYKNHLIYGKDETEGIVSIEVKNDEVYAYFNDGRCLKQPAMYFICASFKIDKDFIRLDGDNDFKFVKTYKSKVLFNEDKKKFWRYKDSTYVSYDDIETHMITRGTTLFKGLEVDNISRLGFDIESDGLIHHSDSIIFMISNTFRDGKGNESKRVFRLDHYSDCGEMLDDWCDYVRDIDPTLLIGHNVIGYDLPYMNHVAGLYNTSLKIGRDDSITAFASRPRKFRVDGSQTWDFKEVKIFGRHVIDTMFLSVKYDLGRNFPSWGLKPIIGHLGLVKKDRQFYDASKIKDNWYNLEEREKIVSYGIDDGDDALNLYELMIPSYFYLTQSLPKSFQKIINSASGAWINSLFLRAYLQDFKSIPKASEVSGFEGAISYGVAGVYTNCFKQDVASLYPSIMRQYEVCDEKKDPEKYFPQVVKYFTLQRLENKRLAKETNKQYYKDLEQSQKLVINSAYGFLATRGANFNSPENASLVTRKGREILSKAMVWSTNQDIDFWKNIPLHTKLDDIDNGSDLVLVNCDTDSIMVAYKDGKEWTDGMRQMFLSAMNDEFEDLIIWEDDGYYDRVVVVKTKNYVLLENGQDKLTYKGSSFKDAKKEPALKEMMLAMTDSLVYNKKEISSIYQDYIEEIKSIKDISRWSTKKSITENLLLANDTTKKKTLNAIGDRKVSVGDKVFLFNDIDGEIQKVVKGELVFLKSTGKPSMTENRIYKVREDFDGSYDVKHYLGRAYKTAEILKSVIDMENITNYSLSKNYKKILDI